MTNWQERPLGELVDIFDHQRIPLSSAERSKRPGPFPYYGAQGVIDRIDDYIFDGRFILIPEDGENLRSRKRPIAYFAQGKFWVNNHAHVVRAKPGVAVDRFIQGAIEASDIGPLVTGAAQPKLSQVNLKKLPLRVPDLKDQTAIASILDSIDDLIDNNRRRVEVLEEMTRAIYREWFVHFRYPGHESVPLVDSPLGPIPDGWTASTVADELTVLGGGTPSRKEPAYWEGGAIHWYTPSDLTKRKQRYATGPEGRITDEGLARSSARRFPEGSVMMTSRATLGVLAIATTEASTNQGFIIIPPDQRWSPGFVYEWLDSNRDELAALGTGATFKEITKGAFKKFPFLVPSPSVLEVHSSLTQPIEAEIRSLEVSAANLASLRDLLLPKLVTGQIDVSSLDLDSLVEASVE